MSSNDSNAVNIVPSNECSERKSQKPEKRLKYLEWDEYFMAMTFLEINRQSNNDNSDAAVVLNSRKIVISVGRSKVLNSDDYVNHAEYKALSETQGARVMYTTSFPCDKCADFIIRSGIKEIVYYKDRCNSDKTKDVFRENSVICRQFVSTKQRIEIDLSQFDV